MHIITIGCAPLALQFVYKTKESADTAYTTLSLATEPNDIIVVGDDFGQTGRFKGAAITSCVIEDCDLSKRAHVERSLHQQRMQTDFQKAAESDPYIRAAMRGPAVISPMGFNGRGN